MDEDDRPRPGVVGPTAGPSRAVPWKVVDCLAVLGLTAVAAVVLANVLGLLAATFGFRDALELALVPLPLVVLAVVTIVWVHLRHRAVGRLRGPVRAALTEWLVGAGLGVACFLAVNVALGLLVQVSAELLGIDLPEPQPQIREAAADPALAPWLLLSAVVVAPLAEELYFRGMLFQALLSPLGRWGAILLSSVVFAGVHVLAEPTWAGGALIFLLILPLGVFLAWLFARRGTLVTPIAVHAVFNGVTMAIMLVAVREGVVAFG